jgi:hypothetical protein
MAELLQTFIREQVTVQPSKATLSRSGSSSYKPTMETKNSYKQLPKTLNKKFSEVLQTDSKAVSAEKLLQFIQSPDFDVQKMKELQ